MHTLMHLTTPNMSHLHIVTRCAQPIRRVYLLDPNSLATVLPELPKVCRVELFGWECARERKIISALVDIPEISTAQFDGEYLQGNYSPCHPALR